MNSRINEKKVCLVSWYTGYNYGTCLQAFALQYVIEKMNLKCEVLDGVYSGKSNYSNLLSQLYERIARKIIRLCQNDHPSEQIQYDIREKYKTEFELRSKGLHSFLEKHYKCISVNEFNNPNIINKYDLFLIGSDQVWNPYHYNRLFMLDFLPCESKIKCSSYATSIGVNNIPNVLKPIYRHYLKRFQHISVRESESGKELEHILKRKIEVVLDPTLLLSANEWNTEFAPEENNSEIPYILCYFVADKPEYWITVEMLVKTTGLKAFVMTGNGFSCNTKFPFLISATPSDFVNYVSNAKLVITDSFHATAFSINFNRDFYVFKRFEDKDIRSQNSRIYELLNTFGLSSRIIDTSMPISLSTIDYDNVNTILHNKRHEAKRYLKLICLGEG